jgi:hypothetical protein
MPGLCAGVGILISCKITIQKKWEISFNHFQFNLVYQYGVPSIQNSGLFLLKGEAMFKKPLSLILVILLIMAPGGRLAYGKQNQEKQPNQAQKVQEDVRRIGTGEKAHIEVRLKDKNILRGYVREAGESSFVVVDSKTGTASTVQYQDVEKIKGKGLSTGAKVALGVGIAVGALVILVLVGLHLAD